MSDLSVEEKIQKLYMAENGIWLVQKGKMTEAKLLKEAYERINYLKKERSYYFNKYQNNINPYKSERDNLLKKLEEQQKINKKLLKSYETIKNSVIELELIGKEVYDV
jgi:biopolymer transport protein ExbB/TolQ